MKQDPFKSPSSRLVTGFAATCVLLTSGCFGPTKSSVGLTQVDSLVSRAQTVQVECEVARDTIRDAVTSMLDMVSPEGETTVVEAFEVFEATIASSIAQEEVMRASITMMERSAAGFFSAWEEDLSAFSSAQMQDQSRARMEATRGMYAQIVNSSEPAISKHAEFNVALADVALFLSRDFNVSAVRSIEGQLRELIRTAGELQREFENCSEHAISYVEVAALPVRAQVQVVATEVSSESESTVTQE